jgi:hypothetical protein
MILKKANDEAVAITFRLDDGPLVALFGSITLKDLHDLPIRDRRPARDP